MMRHQSAKPAYAELPGAFLARTLPFSDLPSGVIEDAAAQCAVDFCPKGTRLLTRGTSEVRDLLLVQSGGVKLCGPGRDGTEILEDCLGAGAAVGACELLRGGAAGFDVYALEDSFFIRMDGEAFLRLAREFPAVSSFYLESFGRSFVDKAFAELLRTKVPQRREGAQPLFSVTVGELARFPAVAIDTGADIVAAAARMAEHGVGSLLVTGEDGKPAGIVTDRDFRYKVLAQGLDYARPVREIMSSPVCGIDHREACFNALITMTQRRIHHLAVEGDGKNLGMVTSHDLMVLQGRSPFSLFADIESARDLNALSSLAARSPQVVRPLVEEGAKASHVARMLSLVHDAVLERVLTLLQGELGPPPVPFCWLALGEEGRVEASLGTEQETALVYQDPAPGQEERCKDYFARCAIKAVTHLAACGIPASTKGMVAATSRSRMPFSEFRRSVAESAADSAAETRFCAALQDCRPAFGFLELGERLRLEAMGAVRDTPGALARLARLSLSDLPPLALYDSMVVDAQGGHSSRFDVKKQGLSFLVDFARLLALTHGVTETGTLARLGALRDAGRLEADLYARIVPAFEYLMQLRLVHRLRLAEEGGRPDDLIDPAGISGLGGRILKGVFRLIRTVRDIVAERYAQDGAGGGHAHEHDRRHRPGGRGGIDPDASFQTPAARACRAASADHEAQRTPCRPRSGRASGCVRIHGAGYGTDRTGPAPRGDRVHRRGAGAQSAHRVP
ncbi:putative nucleotidyltransferase substrate binding domain-containing protein [Desulfolutivibrio sulfoxidireducens]|uniref:putative nucleotidyltransferase substrate binding domain-containing protein n=1 Tax=Desulfolutivibrio sulfoxidireducens TaxID=2773299 RepID=UPI00159D8AB1|nr:putative nucleotidyltransferase substrate binding domain-containing protein [Desulfolutivibrio sulfoxidireducens]